MVTCDSLVDTPGPPGLARVVEFQRPSDRLMTIKVLAGKSLINIVSGYAPQIVRGIPEEEDIIIGADLNCHVGETARGYEACHGGFGYGLRNEEGEKMLETLETLELVFKKRDEHLTTY
ncbi:uncharacterized protein LOC134763683 [Penaeus indicus]|uniref:uncharacterized protein LOC134763683 n=1 Tax=Penaeus indicus TaxID=29960 RepID=UPI00300C08CB